jgi:hypothetical protein
MPDPERIAPIAIMNGLASAERATLATLLALYEDTGLFTLLKSRIQDTAGRFGRAIDAFRNLPVGDAQEAFARRLTETGQRIDGSGLPTDALRLALWAHLRGGFGLDPALSLSPPGLKAVCGDVASQASLAFAVQLRDEARAAQSLGDRQYWRDRLAAMNPFGRKAPDFVPFDTVVRATAVRLIGAALDSDDVPAGLKDELSGAVRRAVDGLDAERHGGLLDQAGMERLGDAAVAKLLVGSGSLIGLSVAVELAGFSAYILAAKASAIIPFIGGKALVSGLFVLTNPLFVVPALLGGGYLVSAKLEASIRRGLSMSAAAILALRGLAGGRTAADRMAEVFRDAGVHAAALEGTDTGSQFTRIFGHRDAPEPAVVHLHPPRLAEYRRQSLALARHVTVPATAADWSGFDRPLGGGDGDAIKDLLFRCDGPDGRPDGRAAAIDTAGLAALTLGDIIYNAASINPNVLKALRQCHNARSIPDAKGFKSIFSLGPYADHLADKAEASAAGAVSRLKGYVGEQYVAAKLNGQFGCVSIADEPNQAGYDLLVQGKEFQVKTRLDLQGVREHFDKNPDIPVYVNSELVDKVAESGEWWAGHVFSVEGFSHEYITDLTERAVAAGGDLVDNHLVEIPVFATAIAAARNTFRWHQGQIPLEDIAWNVAVEGASKGSLSVVGGFAGKRRWCTNRLGPCRGGGQG